MGRGEGMEGDGRWEQRRRNGRRWKMGTEERKEGGEWKKRRV